jgi:hypothetical protein
VLYLQATLDTSKGYWKSLLEVDVSDVGKQDADNYELAERLAASCEVLARIRNSAIKPKVRERERERVRAHERESE